MYGVNLCVPIDVALPSPYNVETMDEFSVYDMDTIPRGGGHKNFVIIVVNVKAWP
jgi:hypothetical protein